MKHAAKLPSRGSASSSAATSPHRRLSHSIAKAPPRKIRIIHVLAPEIIKTEARHFRELVQRLTGKPSPNGSGSGSAASTEDASSSPPPQDSCDSARDVEGPSAGAGGAAAAIELKVKEEAETSSGDEGGGFLRALELDGCNDMFFQGLEDFLFSSSCDMEGFNF
ncbi:unnamed protein product [Urochloa humidicola]